MVSLDGCEILHHQKDGWNPIITSKSWDVDHLSTGDHRISLAHPLTGDVSHTCEQIGAGARGTPSCGRRRPSEPGFCSARGAGMAGEPT